MKKQVPLTAVLAVALTIVAIVVYLGVVKPKQARSARLDDQIARLEDKLAATERPATPGKPTVQIDVADVFRLAKAMPDSEDMAGIILELNSIAVSAGVRFVSIAPQPPVAKEGYHTIPITLTFQGNYYDLTDFLYRLRNLVTVRDGVLDATGRLYTLDALDMQEGEGGFPEIQATLTISAHSYGAPPVQAGTAGAQPASTSQSTTGTSTTGTTTTGTTTTTSSGPPADPSGDGSQQAAGGTG